jgi:hypothetical protein
MSHQMNEPIKVFLSYSHKDNKNIPILWAKLKPPEHQIKSRLLYFASATSNSQ